MAYARWDEAAYWQALYSGGYEKALETPSWFALRRERLRKIASPPCRVLVAGCGYGHLVCLLGGAGYDAVGVDFSKYLWRRMKRLSPCSEAVVKGDVRDHTGSYDLVVTDDMISSYTDATERVSIYAACDRLAPRTVHFVSCGQRGDSSLLWQSLADWRKDNPNHLYYEANGDG